MNWVRNGRNLRVGYGGSRERGLSVLWEDEEESSKKPLTMGRKASPRATCVECYLYGPEYFFFTWPPRAVLLGKAYLW